MSVGAGPPKSFPPLAEALLPVYKLTFLCIYLPIKLPFPLPHLSLAWLVGIKYIACTLNQNNQERILSSQPCWFFVLYITIYVVWQNKKICNQIKDWKEKKRGISSIYYIYILYTIWELKEYFYPLKWWKMIKEQPHLPLDGYWLSFLVSTSYWFILKPLLCAISTLVEIPLDIWSTYGSGIK